MSVEELDAAEYTAARREEQKAARSRGRRPLLEVLFGAIDDRICTLIYKPFKGDNMFVSDLQNAEPLSQGRLVDTNFWRGTITLETRDDQFETFHARNIFQNPF